LTACFADEADEADVANSQGDCIGPAARPSFDSTFSCDKRVVALLAAQGQESLEIPATGKLPERAHAIRTPPDQSKWTIDEAGSLCLSSCQVRRIARMQVTGRKHRQ
jgi:hypothetical protein